MKFMKKRKPKTFAGPGIARNSYEFLAIPGAPQMSSVFVFYEFLGIHKKTKTQDICGAPVETKRITSNSGCPQRPQQYP